MTILTVCKALNSDWIVMGCSQAAHHSIISVIDPNKNFILTKLWAKFTRIFQRKSKKKSSFSSWTVFQIMVATQYWKNTYISTETSFIVERYWDSTMTVFPLRIIELKRARIARCELKWFKTQRNVTKNYRQSAKFSIYLEASWPGWLPKRANYITLMASFFLLRTWITKTWY